VIGEMTETADTADWESAWTPTRYARNGEVSIAYDTLASSKGDPLLLVIGLGVSRFWWPLGFCRELADRGFAVARYDQRDAGQSSRMPDTGASNPFVALARRRGAYTSEDMTDDAVAVLDALVWLVVLPGVGHDLPAALWPVMADEVRATADLAGLQAQ
jgi:pimeloyl-ACP methyl ester carboxylesterase